MKVSSVKPTVLKGLPFYLNTVAAGFPSPADDYIEQGLSIDELLIKHPSATYLVRAHGDSMIRSGIFDQDILIVDRAIEPKHKDIVVAAVDGELTCKYLDLINKQLVSANRNYGPIAIKEATDLIIEGVVVSSIRLHRTCSR